MRTTLSISLSLSIALLGLACQEPSASAPTKVVDKSNTPVSPEKTSTPSASDAKTVTHVEKALRMAKHPFKRAELSVSDAQLEAIVASSYEVFETTDEPTVRVFVFHYDAQELVKPAKVARWINEKGLIHNGQTSANRLRIIVAGTPEAGSLEGSCAGGEGAAELKDKASCEGAGHSWKRGAMSVMNDFMDAFMVMR